MSNNIIVPQWIRTHFKSLNTPAKWLYVCLVDIAGDTKTCTISLRKLSTEANIALSIVKIKLNELREAGLIKIEGDKITIIEIDVKQIEKITIESKKASKHKNEIKNVDEQIRRAIEANVPATLIFGEWVATLEYFEWKCAYCQGSYDVIEHFIPVTLGGGTTKSNCVPACMACNRRKNSYHPLLMPSYVGMDTAIQLVKQYLDSCKED